MRESYGEKESVRNRRLTGSAGGRIEETTAPTDNLAAIIRNSTFVVGPAVHLMGKTYPLDPPKPVGKITPLDEDSPTVSPSSPQER